MNRFLLSCAAAAGVLRGTDDGREVASWGVNYYAPFSLDYRALKAKGVDPKAAIREDLAQFRRLGLDCLRLHCFDRQISQRDGALADTVHLELLDYLVAEAAKQGLQTVLTPIAWYGWDHLTPVDQAGFSNLAPMDAFTSRPDLWRIQARFLREFVAHTNRYTGVAYGHDPCILAFECINEPLYPKDWPQTNVTAYVDTLVDALRTGTDKPVFFNSWNGHNAAVGDSKADGISGSCYPLGLLRGRAHVDPLLARITESTLKPDASVAKKARMIYEFDPADTLRGCYFTPLAKLFRAEGVQIAAQFQYDPTALADVNENWHTHYMNLVYTPKKALALAIAGRAFKRLARGTPYAPAAERMAFDGFRVDEPRDLSELATETEFLFAGDTTTHPPAPEKLTQVWGVGRSPVAASDGSGAFFLDRVSPGVWNLEVYPNVFSVRDPFTWSRDVKTERVGGDVRLRLNLPGLQGELVVKPGAYTVSAAEGVLDVKPRATCSFSEANKVVPTCFRPRLRVTLPRRQRAGSAVPLDVQSVFVDTLQVEMRSVATGETAVRDIPRSGWLAPGVLPSGATDLVFVGKGRHGSVRYPESGAIRFETVEYPADWNWLDAPLAATVGVEGRKVLRTVGTDPRGYPSLRVADDPAAKGSWTVVLTRSEGAAFRRAFPQAPTGTVAVVHGRACGKDPVTVDVVFVEQDQKSWRGRFKLTPEWSEIRVPVEKMTYCSDWPWVPKLKPGDRPDIRGSLLATRLEFAPQAGFEISAIRIE